MNQTSILRVLIIHADAYTRQQLQTDLSRAALADVSVWTCDNPIAGREQSASLGAHVVMLDLDSDPAMALESIPALRATGAQVIGLTNPILQKTGQAQLMRAAIRQGAYDFLDMPLQEQELVEVFHRIRGQQAVGDQMLPEGRAIGVMGIKGGVGATTVALNLASALARNTNKKVAFVDGCLQFGDAAATQGLEITRTLTDLDEQVDPTLRLEQWLDLDPRSQVYFLHRPADLRRADEISPEQFTRVLVRLLHLVDYLVVDLPGQLDLFTFSAMEVCARTVVVMDPKPVRLDRAKALSTALQTLGLLPSRLVWAVNRPLKLDSDFVLGEGPEDLDLAPLFDLPHEPRLAELYGTGGMGVAESGRTPFARDFEDLTKHLLEEVL